MSIRYGGSVKATLASYNIHRCYGRDGNYDPARIRDVLRLINADVVALQEVELLREDPGLLDYFCEGSSWQAIHGPTLERRSAHYGNALLTSLPVRSVGKIDISEPGREPRGALQVDLQAGRSTLQVLATHLGLRPSERRAQVKRLLSVLNEKARPLEKNVFNVLMGDLNEWFLWGRPIKFLRSHFNVTPAPATFPAHRPLFALDRIWLEPGENLIRIGALKNKLTRTASDHLPLIANIDLGRV